MKIEAERLRRSEQRTMIEAVSNNRWAQSGSSPPFPAPEFVTSTASPSKRLLDVSETAEFLKVSESWIRRHIAELPTVHVGRLVRFDSALLLRKFSGKIPSGKSLKPERKLMPSRYQRGSVYKRGSKVQVWYGIFREDVGNTSGHVQRRQRKVRLGTVTELPTKNAARSKLSELLNGSSPTVELDFQELATRWKQAEGSTMKPTTLRHYQNTLRAYVIPAFGTWKISSINREDVQTFLANQAKKYSKSTLRSMRVVLGLTLGWAKNCGWLPHNPCDGVRLPRVTNGRKVMRTILTPPQVSAIAEKLEEPYASLVLFFSASGLRIGEAIALKWSDFDGEVLYVTRRIYDGAVDTVKTVSSARKLPISSTLLERLRQLGDGEWVFRSREGTPINPGNGLKRYVRPAAKRLGIPLGGWHNFRHSMTTNMRRNGVHPKVVSGVLGHAKVQLAMNTYDHTNVEDFRLPLATIAEELLPNVTKNTTSM